MSELLDAIIEERRNQVISYQDYLEKIKALAHKVIKPQGDTKNSYPSSIDTQAKRALFDNLNSDEILANKIDTVIRYTKKADWVGDRFKEREVANAIRQELDGYEVDIATVLELAKNQREYQ
jgi:type I restriction enzyme R subunit